MKTPFTPRAASFDAAAIQLTIQRALAAAGLDAGARPQHGLAPDLGQTANPPLHQTLNQALNLRRAWSPAGPAGAASEARHDNDKVIDVVARVVRDGHAAPDAGGAPQTTAGRFERRSYSGSAGARAYMLYVPAGQAAEPRPLLVMLHGCTQSADDFAAGTQMNRLADAHGLLVVYPEQTAQANASKCWNWFRPQDQGRDAGEPAVIAGIVREVAQAHGADMQRIFVAGLSAGGAMAVVLGQTHPDLFAGVGVHSGLPYGSAQDVPSALAAMKGGRGRSGHISGDCGSPVDLDGATANLPGLKNLNGLNGLNGLRGLTGLNGVNGMPMAGSVAAGAPPVRPAHAVPVIVFHGDRDHTVQQSNAAQIVRQAEQSHAAQATLVAAETAEAGPGQASLRAAQHEGQAAGGRRFTRTVHTDAQGRTHIESWTLHGAGHAWSGGSPTGSYTDAAGPDASAEMLRFFLALARPAAHPGSRPTARA